MIRPRSAAPKVIEIDWRHAFWTHAKFTPEGASPKAGPHGAPI
jgi:hypothetical protein